MKKNTLKLHLETLPPHSQQLLPKLASFNGILAGGSALALLLGHRKSYDLDFFFEQPLKEHLFQAVIQTFGPQNCKLLINTSDELSLIIKETKVSFVYFPFPPLHKLLHYNNILLFHLNDLATNKAYVMGRRAAWRDYVDIYFLLTDAKLTLAKIINEAKKRFRGAFSARLFLQQLTYYNDIRDYALELTKAAASKEEIKNFFKKQVKDYLEKQAQL
jgi:hypothetical protein